MKSAICEGYIHIKYLEKGSAVFKDLATKKFEVWHSNPNHANYGFHYNNTDWEFVCSYTGDLNIFEENKKPW